MSKHLHLGQSAGNNSMQLTLTPLTRTCRRQARAFVAPMQTILKWTIVTGNDFDTILQGLPDVSPDKHAEADPGRWEQQ